MPMLSAAQVRRMLDRQHEKATSDRAPAMSRPVPDRRRWAGWRFAFAIVGAVAFPARAQLPPARDAISRAISAATAAGAAGEIALADLTGVVADSAFGLADRARGRGHRIGARWIWGSVTKQLTALLVMQEVSAGRLSLDGTIRDYLPTFSGSTGGAITVRQLLQHQSGLPNPDGTPPDAEGTPRFYTERGRGIRDAARAVGFCAGPVSAPAGGPFSYNNCDYFLVGAILERVSGMSFAELVRARIAGPLRLSSVRLATDGAVRGGAAAIGYAEGGRPTARVNVATFGAAGALTGTAADLLLLDRAMLQGRLLSGAARDTLWHGIPALGYQALGVWAFPATLRGCKAPVMVVERRGSVAGIQVRNILAPALGRSLAVFVNDDAIEFGEIWQGQGLAFDIMSAVFCPA